MRPKILFLQTIICLIILGVCAFGPGALQASAEVTVDATLSHLSFPQDKLARLTIEVTGTSHNAEIELPEIDNIRLQSRGQSSRISVINGSISSSISYEYLVQAQAAGRYTIPPIKVIAGGNSYLTKPLDFQVTAAGVEPREYSSTSGLPTGEIAFIRVSEKNGSHFPGEIVPLTIKAYFSQAYRADINSLPSLNGDGVVMSQLQDKPQQTEESVNGRMYHVLIWDTSISGIKVGEHPIHFSLDATLLIPQKRRSMSPFGGNSLFNDPFFNNSDLDSFFGSTQRKPIVSVSPEIVFNVVPLPTDTQPADFTGAIGDFDLKVSATPVNVEVGEPLTLTMKVSGTGNFDRVEAPLFPDSPDWKTYAPTSEFSDQGRSYAGTKIFEQAIVAKSGAVSEIPSLSFTYFDPATKRYITKTSKPLALHVKGPVAQPAAQAPQSIQPVAKQQQQLTTPAPPTSAIVGLAPIHLEIGTYHQRIIPLFKNVWLIAICSLCVLVLIALLVLKLRQRKVEKYPELQLRRQKKLQLERDLKKIEEAQAMGDGPSFLSFCRTAIQNQLGLLWNMEPAAISLADISSRLKADSPLFEIFRAADEAAYGGATLTDKKMQNYIITLKTELENLL